MLTIVITLLKQFTFVSLIASFCRPYNSKLHTLLDVIDIFAILVYNISTVTATSHVTFE